MTTVQAEEETDWVSVTNKRAHYRAKRRQIKKQWETLKSLCPHLITPQHARRLARRLNVDQLAECLQSQECIALQMDGWQYKKVLTSSKIPVPDDDDAFTYCTLTIADNKWGDRLLFQRRRLKRDDGGL